MSTGNRVRRHTRLQTSDPCRASNRLTQVQPPPRRLSFRSPVFYPQTPSNRAGASVNSARLDSLSESQDEGTYWSPGQTLPPLSSSDTTNEILELQSMIQDMHRSVQMNFKDMNSHISRLEDRVSAIEVKQRELTSTNSSSSTTPSGSPSPEMFGRKRRSPSELQHEIRSIHSSLEEGNQMHPEERIDSDHNKKVVLQIMHELGTSKYNRKQIQDGIRIYRKTLKESTKGRPEEVQNRVRVQSRQQRLFERRAKVVKKKESEMQIWEYITPDMMSEEEEDGDQDGFIRHQPSWRSNVLNRFISKLEKRIKKNSKNSLAKKRRYGTTIDKDAPPNLPSWMTEKGAEVTEQDNDQDILEESLSSENEEFEESESETVNS